MSIEYLNHMNFDITYSMLHAVHGFASLRVVYKVTSLVDHVEARVRGCVDQ